MAGQMKEEEDSRMQDIKHVRSKWERQNFTTTDIRNLFSHERPQSLAHE
jgi:hypothetical protein